MGPVPVVITPDGVAAPDDLPSAERVVWNALAPYAIATRTLTPATLLSFRLLCRNVVLEATLA